MNGSETQPGSQTIEQVLFERMGVTVENAVATGTDVVDEKVAAAVSSGINVDERINGLGQLIEKLSEPSTIAAVSELLESLPQLAQLAKLSNELPNILATVGDVLDSCQQRYAAQNVDVEKAITNGIHAAMFVGSKVDSDHLERIGDLLGSDVLNPSALNVVDNAAKALNSSHESVCEKNADRVGVFGMLRALRDPQIQRSLAFAVQFGKCFGKNIDEQ